MDKQKCIACRSSNLKFSFEARDYRYRPHDRYNYYECQNCGAINLAQASHTESLNAYYSDYETHSDHKYSKSRSPIKNSIINAATRFWAATSKHEKSNQSSIGGYISYFLKYISGPITNWSNIKIESQYKKTLLDVGAGGGYFCSKMIAKGWVVHAVEPDERAEVYRNPEVQVYKEIGELTAYGMYDLITFNHTLEHMVNGREQVKIAFDLLKPGGQLTIVTPNSESALFKKFTGMHWHADAPRHVCMYGKLSILNILQQGRSVLYYNPRANRTSYLKTMAFKETFGQSSTALHATRGIIGTIYAAAGIFTGWISGKFCEEIILCIHKDLN
jgi:2-polyprenyl-3-methyl-5-hydroxy-6-metoxy-1,4-benzoquinol methylase